MATARVMYVSGNYERFEEEVDLIDESWLMRSADRNLLALLRSNLAEINGDYSVAKRVLEKAIPKFLL